MKQITQNLRTGKLRVDELPIPQVQPGYVLVQTAYSLISAGTERTKIETGRKSLVGKALARPDQVKQVIQSVSQIGLQSTMEKVKTRLESRSPLGYSAAGIVLQVGKNVDEFRPGDMVACGGASAAHAEIISVPRNLCVKVHDNVSLDEAAFATVGAIALQGVRQADGKLGETVVVIGLGLLGQLTVQLLKASGCRAIGYDLDESRCRLALRFGADDAVWTEKDLEQSINKHSEDRGADGVIITAGTSSSRPVEIAGEISRDKGRVVVVGAVGMSLPRPPYYEKELELRLSRSYGPGRYDPTYEEKGIDYPIGYVRWTERRNMSAFLHLIGQKKVEVASLITHRFSLDQANEAYDLISNEKSESFLGVLFEYDTSKQVTSNFVNIRPALDVQENLMIGVIGAGNFAQSMLLPHLKNNPKVTLLSVATLVPLESRDVAERFSFQTATTEPDVVFNDERINAIIIATRHNSHADLAIRGLQAGKAVYLEKPLAMTEDELENITEAYSSPKERQASLMVGFNRRFAPMVQDAYQFISKTHEPLTMLYRINSGYIPSDHWTQDPSTGGGRIIGEVCHFIDLLHFFAGSPISSIYASAMPNISKYSDDNVVINIAFTNGSIGTILYTANGDKALPKEYLEVFSGGKVAVIDNFQKLTCYSGGKKTIITKGARDKGHKGEIEAWLEAIQNARPEPVPFSDSVLATRASFAVIESINTGEKISLE